MNLPSKAKQHAFEGLFYVSSRAKGALFSHADKGKWVFFRKFAPIINKCRNESLHSRKA